MVTPTPADQSGPGVFLIRWTKLKERMAAAGIPILQKKVRKGACFIVTCFHRSNADQAFAYAQGRTAPGNIVTNAKPGESPHNWCMAKDVALVIDGKLVKQPRHMYYTLLHDQARKCGLETGQNWHGLADAGHVQLIEWQNYTEAMK